MKAITRSVLGKTGESSKEVTDERLKGIDPKMVELIMNEVVEFTSCRLYHIEYLQVKRQILIEPNNDKTPI